MKKTLVSCIAFLTTFIGMGQPGSLDPTFGMGGKIVTEFSDGSFDVRDATKQKDGKILVTGAFDDNHDKHFIAITRYFENGELDYAFGDSGRVLTDLGYEWQQGMAIVTNTEGKIFLAGEVVDSRIVDEFDIFLLKYNNDGTVDVSFGDEGVSVKNFRGDDYPYDIALEENEKIIVAGHSADGFLTARFLSTGEIDSGFADNGSSIAFQGLGFARSVLIQPDGKIVVGGSASTYMAARYMPDGKYDSSFGINGKFVFSYNTSLFISKIALTNTGSIVGIGQRTNSAISNDIILIQHTATGHLDSTFGTNGITILASDTLNSRSGDIAVQDDKLVAFGFVNSFSGNYRAVLIARYLSDGQLDETFADRGIQHTIFTTAGGSAVSGFIDDHDKIVMAGWAFTSPAKDKQEIILARYNSDSTTEKNKYVKIKKWLHRHGITWDDCPAHICDNLQYYTVERSTNGQAFIEIARLFRRNNITEQYFEDLNASIGTSNYRVGIVNAQNTIKYSNILQLSNNPTTIKLYPNPVRNSLYMNGLPASKTKLTIIDLAGNPRMTATVNSNIFAWNISQLPKNIYVLHIQTGGEVVVKQFFKE